MTQAEQQRIASMIQQLIKSADEIDDALREATGGNYTFASPHLRIGAVWPYEPTIQDVREELGITYAQRRGAYDEYSRFEHYTVSFNGVHVDMTTRKPGLATDKLRHTEPHAMSKGGYDV